MLECLQHNLSNQPHLETLDSIETLKPGCQGSMKMESNPSTHSKWQGHDTHTVIRVEEKLAGNAPFKLLELKSLQFQSIRRKGLKNLEHDNKLHYISYLVSNGIWCHYEGKIWHPKNLTWR